jgi:hypothetical protein
MKKIYYLKGIITGLSCFCMIVLALTPVSYAQGFISREDRPRWNDRYENFSNYDYRNFSETPTLIDARDKGVNDIEYVNPVWHGQADPFSFDKLGNFMLPGGDIYNMTWDRSSAGTNEFFDDGQDGKTTIFDNLMISSDEFSNWMTKFMIGKNMRAYFTPSTLKKTNMNGIRWDASSRKNNFTLIADVGSRNLFGAHWQSVLGDVLKLGGSFVANQRGTEAYSNVDYATGSGSVSLVDLPRYVYVVITSDSPEDASIGARVYEVQALIDGNVTPIPQRAFKIANMFYANRYSDGQFRESNPLFGITNTQSNSSLNQVIEDRLYNKNSWFLSLISQGDDNETKSVLKQLFHKGATSSGVKGFLNIENLDGDATDPQGRYYWDANNPNDPTGMSPKDQFNSQGYLEASGTDVIIYEFLVPSGARGVDFRARVANDYCIDVVAALPGQAQKNTGNWDAQEDDYTYAAWAGSFGGDNWLPKYDYKHCLKAPGKVNDLSNTQWVQIAYDRLTGVNVYGLNAELNWRGLFVKAEFNEYNTLWAYPVHSTFKGEERNKESARAWFINFEKDFGKWSVGGEVFDYPNEYMQYWSTIDDNDDNNHRTGYNTKRWMPQTNFNGSPEPRQFEYPGLNADWDLAGGQEIDAGYLNQGSGIDTKFDGQPFITYYFDEVSYGDDFNHNGIIDARENDTAIDLPYEQDSRGQHYFLKLKPLELTTFTYGHYDIEQDIRGGRNLTDYLKIEHMQRVGSVLEYGIFHRLERVQDTYQSNDVYYQYFGKYATANLPNTDHYSDSYGMPFNNMAFKNSLLNTSMLKTKLTLIPNLNIVNNLRYEAINRLGDLTVNGSDYQKNYKAPRDIVTSTTIHKIDYTYRLADFRIIPDIFWRGIRIVREKRIKEFKLQPQFKFINSYFTGDLGMRHNGGRSYTYYPVLRFDYRVAPKTVLRFAMQGFPGMMEKNRNTVAKLEEIDRRRMFFGFETLTLYQGFNLLVTSGMRRDKKEWIRSFGRPEIGTTEYFITLRVEASR